MQYCKPIRNNEKVRAYQAIVNNSDMYCDRSAAVVRHDYFAVVWNLPGLRREFAARVSEDPVHPHHRHERFSHPVRHLLPHQCRLHATLLSRGCSAGPRETSGRHPTVGASAQPDSL